MRRIFLTIRSNTAQTAGGKLLPLMLCLLLVAASGRAFAQADSLRSIVQQFDAYRRHTLQEKLYLHLDRPAYVCGETMWFKVYAVDGTLHQPLTISKVAYVEVLDEANKPVLQGKIALRGGLGNGSFVLPVSLGTGKYKVRAYTNWMKNFGSEVYFQAPVTLVNTFAGAGALPAADAPAYTVRFFPEGGNLVQGVRSVVAFEAVQQGSGKGVAVTGQVVNQRDSVVATLQTQQFGLGRFAFTPLAGETYTALVQLPQDKQLRLPLPKAQTQGYSLHLEEESAGQLKLTVAAAGKGMEPVFLLGHARGLLALSEAAYLQNGTATFLVDKQKLAEGITHFTVFNSQKQPVSERLYFTRPTQLLQLDATTDKSNYTTRDKVNLHLQTLAQPGPANLSLAVFRMDSLQAAAPVDIAASLWLTSELKGNVENPAYYLTATGPAAAEAADNLMLTHGWSRFCWEEVLQQPQQSFAFAPEYDGHFIRARVTDAATGGAARDITTYLAAPGKHIRLYNGKSDVNGYVQFEVKDFYGPKDLVLQADYTRDSTQHFELLSPFSDKYASEKLPALQLPEQWRPDLAQRHLAVQVQDTYFGKYRDRFRTPGIDSTAFYGHADQTFLLDDYKRFKVMEEVMREYVSGVQVRLRRDGFHFMVHDMPHKFIFQNDPMVLLDGVPVFDINKIMAFDPLKVRKLEVMERKYFNGPLAYNGLVSYTTYQGDLAGFPLDPHALLVEYEGLQLQREFYAPVYETPQQKQSRLADFRNLLYWAPDITTQGDGKASQTFYTSDQAGTYVVVVQGLSASGLAGSRTFTFEVRQPL